MLQGIRQKYYYPGMAKHVKKWVEGCETCVRDKRVPKNTITTELLKLPEWDLGLEDAMQIDLLPNLPTSGGYQTVMTAIDVFSRYLFAYALIEATATNVAKVILDMMTKHSYIPTTFFTDKNSAFTSTILAEITQILGETLKCATTKHPQTIGKLERTHASLEAILKIVSGEYRRQWHKYLPVAVLNYNTTYHSSIGCEPSKVFHGRIPFNVPHHNLGNNSNKKFLPTREFAEEDQQRTQILIDQTKKNIMQSYLKYKDYYDRKAKEAPLKEKDYCFVLQPKADSQASKIPFREYKWISPFVVQTVLSNDNYIVRRLNTNKTQILHRNSLKKFVPNAPLEDKYDGEKLQPDNEIVIPQDDLYTISWELDFEYELFEPRKDHWTDVATRRPTDAEDSSVDHYVIENESRSERTNEDDVTENETRSQSRNSRDVSSPLDETTNETQIENDVTYDLQDAGIVSNRRADITVPGISEKENSEENSSPRGGRYNLRPNSNPNLTDEYRY